MRERSCHSREQLQGVAMSVYGEGPQVPRRTARAPEGSARTCFAVSHLVKVLAECLASLAPPPVPWRAQSRRVGVC